MPYMNEADNAYYTLVSRFMAFHTIRQPKWDKEVRKAVWERIVKDYLIEHPQTDNLTFVEASNRARNAIEDHYDRA